MEFFETLAARHSVRSYSPDPVPRELLQKVIGAAALAPSSYNEQPWHYYVTQGASRDRLVEIMAQSTTYLEEYIDVLGPERYEHALRWYDGLGEAPVVVACTIQRGDTELQDINRLFSIGASTQNLLLAATAVGLAACNITFAFLVREDIERALGIPEDRTLVSIISLGYPSDEPPAAPPHSEDIAEYLD